jgi:hypothetical protein
VIRTEDRVLPADATELAGLETGAIGHPEAHADHEARRASAKPAGVIEITLPATRIAEELDRRGLVRNDPGLARERFDDRSASDWREVKGRAACRVRTWHVRDRPARAHRLACGEQHRPEGEQCGREADSTGRLHGVAG